jgi:hypothetical protein
MPRAASLCLIICRLASFAPAEKHAFEIHSSPWRHRHLKLHSLQSGTMSTRWFYPGYVPVM